MVANYKRQIITLQEEVTIDKATLGIINAALNALDKAIWLNVTQQCNADITNLSSLIDATAHPSLEKTIGLLLSHVGAFNTAAKRYQVAAAASKSFTKDTLPKDVAKELTNARTGANKKKTNTISVVVDCLNHFIQQATNGSTSKEAQKIRAESAIENALMKSKTDSSIVGTRSKQKRNEASKTAAAVSSFKPNPNKAEPDSSKRAKKNQDAEEQSRTICTFARATPLPEYEQLQSGRQYDSCFV